MKQTNRLYKPGENLGLMRKTISSCCVVAPHSIGFRDQPNIIGLCFLFCCFAFVTWSESYSLHWWTGQGTAGTSTGGLYRVTGTVGQPNATPYLSRGRFTIIGGFWSWVTALQTQGAPYLKVTFTATNSVVVSWPMADGSGWVLQAANTLSAPSIPWHTIPPPYQTNGEHLQYIEPVPYGTKFYRLSKP
ncbi:MAG: hypothetical protein GX456_18540 [Verrucomicrobia bacterium]|nr:hypothetical protein [Verrucomicrobiota bacterium]